MRATILRLVLILISFLLTATWFPQSFLPVWLLVFSIHFFSIREGIFLLIGYCVLAATLEYHWTFFLLLWFSFSISVLLKMILPHKKTDLPQFVLLCLALSIGMQITLFRNTFENTIFITIKHFLLIGIALFPAKILGEAYQRYFTALGRNHE